MSEKVVLLTGASQGIGAAAALEFATRGYNVALVARNKDNLEAVAAKVRDAGREALVCAGDLSDLEFAENAVRQTVEKWGRMNVLVNNAAWREVVTMRNISLESWEKTLRICLTAPAFLARWAATHMEQNGGGAIINISSIQSQQVGGIAPAYIAAKGGLDSLTFELAVLYGRHNIRVVGLNLGAIDTEMSNDYQTPDGQTIEEQSHQWRDEMVPLGRYGTPEEAAKTIAWLASEDASYITGAGIIADGGWSRQFTPYSIKRAQFPNEF